MSCNWMTMPMVVVLFAVATMIIPTVDCVRCYKGKKANSCTDGLCFKAECADGWRLNGCFPASMTWDGPREMGRLCHHYRAGPYISGTLKFCYCDNCNHFDHFRCEGTGGGGSGAGGWIRDPIPTTTTLTTSTTSTTTTTTTTPTPSPTTSQPSTTTTTMTMSSTAAGKTKIPGRRTQWRFGTRKWLMSLYENITPFPPGAVAKIGGDDNK